MEKEIPIDEDPEHTIEDCLMKAVKAGRMTKEEAQEAFDAYERTFHKEDRRIPIRDKDTLASPIGFYETPRSVLD